MPIPSRAASSASPRPSGPIERGEIDWYLERYSRWPNELVRDRAQEVERSLPKWGREIYELLRHDEARNTFEAWRHASGVVRRFSVGDELPDAKRPFVRALRAVAEGSRDAGLASDPGMKYDEVVELRLLLEAVVSAG